jgi:hypothetical protein
MTQSRAVDGLGILRQLLQLLANIRNLAQPLASAAGLEQALNSLVQLSNLLGIGGAWVAQLQSVLTDPTVFNVVLLIVQQLLGSDSQDGPATPSPLPAPTQSAAADEATLNQWRPFASEMLGLLRQIRGEQ